MPQDGGPTVLAVLGARLHAFTAAVHGQLAPNTPLEQHLAQAESVAMQVAGPMTAAVEGGSLSLDGWLSSAKQAHGAAKGVLQQMPQGQDKEVFLAESRDLESQFGELAPTSSMPLFLGIAAVAGVGFLAYRSMEKKKRYEAPPFDIEPKKPRKRKARSDDDEEVDLADADDGDDDAGDDDGADDVELDLKDDDEKAPPRKRKKKDPEEDEEDDGIERVTG